ncbi:S41 family peptidase [Urechidicola vernalis]|uniref:Tricorn protease homolog n=1 Tax=Urechidicola vernalis TaxID=3075600 RepID=A0ABU2Y6M7_9FLAO|nr:S41 family peptidase [Urechidicola sp. P050]MDT0553854.1 S41 family peptidase [Urechidicola sp. P050]
MISHISNSAPLKGIVLLFLIAFQLNSLSQGFDGYYRFPAVHENTVVFTAEGDLWTVSLDGGLAQRLTTHQEEERYPIISPDGKTVAYSASYEGPTELYTIPINGGLPTRWTYESSSVIPNNWTENGEIAYATRNYSTLPDWQTVKLNTQTKQKKRIPLSQASEASFDTTGKTIFFVRPAYHGNVTKRYQGGTARQIWKFTEGMDEAVKLTTDHPGESHHPMWINNRVYFITDRDGTMNLWSMDTNGGDKKQHTKHEGFDVRYAKNSKNTIVYQLGADIWKYDVNSNSSNKIDIRLATDLDQLREKWDENPSQYITAVNPNKDGSKIVITARGRAFVAPVKSGRFIEFTHQKNVRYRDATFSSDGKNIYTLSDESGEFEFVSMPSNGIGSSNSITSNGSVLRLAGVPSPDGKWIAYDDLENNMFILNIASGESKKISNNEEGIGSFSWSPDSKWISFVQYANNTMAQIHIYNLDSSKSFELTSDRANSLSPQWSPDGKFIYFLSDRSFTTLVGGPWGPRQPEPYFDASEKLYHVALNKGVRSPFRPNDEMVKKEEKQEKKSEDKKISVTIDIEGIASRIIEVPIKAGNYNGLAINKKAIYLASSSTGINSKSSLSAVKIDNKDVKLKTMIEGIQGFNLTSDGSKILVRKGNSFFMVPAGTSKISDLTQSKIDLSGWKFSITPREDWKQLFTDAWRMERDYFYDKNMHGVNWKGMYDKYFPLVDRVTTRVELSDLIGRFVGELSALHTSVRGGDTRGDQKNISVASLGARFSRDENAGGYRIEYIYKADPDYPDEKSPLDDPYLDINEGDIITSINGVPTLSSVDIGALIRNKSGKQVRLSISSGSVSKDVIVVPFNNEYNLRYRDWEYTRRLEVEEKTNKDVGYVHLRAMGSSDLNQWYREFYPVFDRPGLIIDVRHNRGGNIESIILEKLLRKAWMYWKSRSGKPYWNMQYAFRGHIVILVDGNTASDGEAFADGFKKLNLGMAIGTRTWGGEIWLHSGNRLSDGGLARAPMMGVYGPDGEWLIEGHGFEPDIEVDNLPHATFNGKDAQLEAAIEHLKKLIKEDPREVPPVPAYPDKSFKN